MNHIRLLCEMVWSVDPELLPSSTFRVNAGFHSQWRSVDWVHSDLKRLFLAFEVLRTGEFPIGCSLGIDSADRHLHTDFRVGAVPKDWPGRVAFIETKQWDGKSSGEVMFWTHRPMTLDEQTSWHNAHARAKKQYGLI